MYTLYTYIAYVYVTCGGLGHIKVLILHRQTLIGPTGYERCDLCVEVYCWSYGDGWLLPARLNKLNDINIIQT